MTNYYFLATFLPPLNINKKPELSLNELYDLLKDHLTDHDFSLVTKFKQGEYTTGFLKVYGDQLELIDDTLASLRSKRLKRANLFSPEEKLLDLSNLYEANWDNPKKLYLGLTEYKLKKIDELTGLQTFSSDIILAYLVKFHLITEVYSLNEIAGLKILDHIEGG